MDHHEFKAVLEANRYSVRKVLELAQAGVLRIPLFQRPLRWGREDHQLLLDSLYRGFPIGTLLLWERAAEASRLVLGAFSVPAPKTGAALWIVDGQQRIATLASCLLSNWHGMAGGATSYSFLFDLQEEQFAHASEVGRGGGAAHPRWVPVYTFSSATRVSQWARQSGASDAQHDLAQRVGERLREYEIPVYLTRAEDDDVLRQVFDRTNSSGRHMRSTEIFDALNIGKAKGKDTQSLLGRLGHTVNAAGFGAVDAKILLKSLVAVAGHDPADDLPAALRVPGAAVEFEAATEAALLRAVDFLRGRCAFPCEPLLPNDLPLVVLTRFFHRFPEPCERSLELLVRWVWRGLVTQRHHVTNQNLRSLHAATRAGHEEQVVQAMLELVPRSAPPAEPLPVFSSPGIRVRLALATIFQAGPRAPGRGQLLEWTSIFEPDSEQLELAPASEAGRHTPRLGGRLRLPHVGEDGKRMAARLLLPPMLRVSAEHSLQRATEEILSSHGFVGDAVAAVRSGAWPEAIDLRERWLLDTMEETQRRHCRWGEEDGPSIAAILAGEGEEP